MSRGLRGLELAFGQAVRKQREKADLSQEGLAFQCGLHRTYVSQIERGLKSPSLGSIYRLATALRVPLPRLIADALEIAGVNGKP
jgi:transcriptional regulator with XRE-family HTH domain